MKLLLTTFLLIFLFSCKSKMPVPDATLPETPEAVAEVTTVTPENVMEASLSLYNKEFANFNIVQHNADSILASHLQIEMIGKELFEQMQANPVSFWDEDAKGAVKIDTVLTLKTRDTVLTFTDNPADTEMHRTFSYEGRLPVINKFVVLGTYYEDYGYMLFDMDTGYNTSTYQAFPLISPDKKYIVTLYANIYSPQSGEMSIEKIGKGEIIPLLKASFTNWMPQELFYGSDGWLYVSVNHPKTYWAPDGEISEEHQYIRIKIL